VRRCKRCGLLSADDSGGSPDCDCYDDLLSADDNDLLSADGRTFDADELGIDPEEGLDYA
jgi:hypothetical protein